MNALRIATLKGGAEMKKVIALVLTGFAFIAAASPGYCSDWYVDTKIVIIEPTYMPTSLVFQANSPGGTCSAGTWLVYSAQGATVEDKRANIDAILAVLLTAQARNSTIRLYGNNTGCSIQNVNIF